MSRRIVAVVACFNRREKTLACLESLQASSAAVAALGVGAIDVIVVDDGSTDGTATAVAERFPDARVIVGDGSLWWGGAMARGLAAVPEAADFRLWLNDDVKLDADALARLVQTHDRWLAENGSGAIVVGATRDPVTGTPSYGGALQGRVHPFRFAPVAPTEQPVRCDAMNGNIVLVPRDEARRLGGIDTVFVGVQGMADTDYALRARAEGIAVVLGPGTAGTCARDTPPPPWRDGHRLLADRIRDLWGPRGYPPKAWSAFARRHGGLLWPVWFILPYLRGVMEALRPLAATRPKRVALLEGIVASYRVPLLRGLARSTDPRFTAFHGPGLAGLTATATLEPLPLPEVRMRNRFWPRGGGRIAWTAGSLTALLSRPAVVVAGFHTHDLGIWTVWLARRLIGGPRLLLTGHFAVTPDGGGLRGALRRLLARGADAVLPYGEAGAAACRALGIRADRIFVTGNSVDVAGIRAVRLRLSDEALTAARRAHGLGQEPVLLFVGRLYASKRVELAIAAVRRLRAAGRSCSLLIVGDGVDRPRLEAIASDDPGIRFAGAAFDEARLAPLFAMATAIVVPGSVGLIAAHAFAYEVPMVACRDVPGHGPEFAYLVDGVNALLPEASSEGALAGALDRLLQEPELRERLRSGARATADQLGVERAIEATLAAVRAV
ncbi:MAG: glycosyltransferase [Candidatus Wallbacteria bacterium]|nr:glycosyltransferase [Candidatus Wallbacteria bacterium]